jgi:hypothetical protein
MVCYFVSFQHSLNQICYCLPVRRQYWLQQAQFNKMLCHLQRVRMHREVCGVSKYNLTKHYWENTNPKRKTSWL